MILARYLAEHDAGILSLSVIAGAMGLIAIGVAIWGLLRGGKS